MKPHTADIRNCGEPAGCILHLSAEKQIKEDSESDTGHNISETAAHVFPETSDDIAKNCRGHRAKYCGID